MKTAISLPDPLFTAAEEYARDKGLSRSELYAQALAYFLHAHRYATVTDELNQLYAEESSALDPALRDLQAQALTKEDW
ncbi:MAG: ChpI protein [Herpetosiphonaceae bacterium]|nr:ChpI protein [Herpetosiphonaceae bacterium]